MLDFLGMDDGNQASYVLFCGKIWVDLERDITSSYISLLLISISLTDRPPTHPSPTASTAKQPTTT